MLLGLIGIHRGSAFLQVEVKLRERASDTPGGGGGRGGGIGFLGVLWVLGVFRGVRGFRGLGVVGFSVLELQGVGR